MSPGEAMLTAGSPCWTHIESLPTPTSSFLEKTPLGVCSPDTLALRVPLGGSSLTLCLLGSRWGCVCGPHICLLAQGLKAVNMAGSPAISRKWKILPSCPAPVTLNFFPPLVMLATEVFLKDSNSHSKTQD